MNWIPGSATRWTRRRRPGTQMRLLTAVIATCGLFLAVSCSATDAPEDAATLDYFLSYRVVPLPGSDQVQVELTLQQPRPLLIEMSMKAPGRYFSHFAGDGDLSVSGDSVVWRVPKKGGMLSWLVNPNRLKTGDRYDAYMNENWAVLRASDIMPPAATRTAKNATSHTSVEFSLPAGWSSVTEYRGKHNTYTIDNPQRRFDRMTGWVLLGQLGIRTEEIAGVKVKIAGPRHHQVHRMDMLALLAWTLPDATRLFPDFPPRLTVISANDPMWRGGLSAPASLYVHASLPLISENGTSTLLHEIVHIGMGASATDGADWIIEGLAEYYGLQLLKRSGSITERRYRRAIDGLRKWGAQATTLCAHNSTGATTAKATLVMHDLDREIREGSRREHNLDDVMRALSQQQQKIRIADLVNAVADILPDESEVLASADLGDCVS